MTDQTRTVRITALGAVTALMLSACGAGSRTPGAEAENVECDVPQPDSAVTINVLAYNSSAIDPFTNTMVSSCSQGNIELRHEPIDFAGQVQRTTATLAGDSGTYDIIETYGFVIPQHAARGSLMPLDQFVEEFSDQYALDEINDDMKQAMSYDGQLYGLPMQAQMHLMAYRSDVFDTLDLEPPTTFEELRTVAQTIQDEGDIEYPIALPLLASNDIITAYDMALGSLGVDLTDPESMSANLDTPEAAQAFEALISLKPFMNPQVTTFDQPAVQQQMYNGNAAMGVMFSGRMNDLTMESNTSLASDFAFAAPPSVEDGGVAFASLSVDGWSIPANASFEPDALFQMIASSVSEDASQAAIPAAYPAREGMVTEDSSPYAVAANATMANVPPAEPYPWTAEITTAITPIVAEVFLETTSIEQGLEEMQAVAEEVLATHSG